VERQCELDRGIVELRDRREWHPQSCWRSTKGQAYREAIGLNLEIPESMLDDDGHLIGEPLGKVLRDCDSGRLGLEGDVEMVAAGKAAGLLDFAKHPSNNRPQCILYDLVVRNQALWGLVAHIVRW